MGADDRKALGLCRVRDGTRQPNVLIMREGPGAAAAYIIPTDCNGTLMTTGRGLDLFRYMHVSCRRILWPDQRSAHHTKHTTNLHSVCSTTCQASCSPMMVRMPITWSD